MPPRKKADSVPEGAKWRLPNKKGPVSRSKVHQGLEPLVYDGLTREEVLALTPEQALDKFASHWMAVIDPFIRYERWWKAYYPNGESRFIKTVKMMYKKLVLEGNWGEKKFVMSLDALFTSNKPLVTEILEDFGKLYDEEKLEFQLREKRVSGRRKRI